MKIEFENRTWQLEPLDADVKQCEVIAGQTGLSLMAWYKSLLDTDSLAWLKSMRCLYWLMLEQNGDSVPVESVNFAPMNLFTAFGEAVAAENGPAEEDPTRPAGTSAAASPGPSPAESLSG